LPEVAKLTVREKRPDRDTVACAIVFQRPCVDRRACSWMDAPYMFGRDDPLNVKCDPRLADETELRDPSAGITYTG